MDRVLKVIKVIRTKLLTILLLVVWSTATFAQDVYVMQRPNDFITLENLDDIIAASYSRPEATIGIDANNDGLEDLLMGPTNFSSEPEFPLVLFINQGGGQYLEDAAGVIDDVPLIGLLNHPSIVADFNGDGADDAFLVDQGLEIGNPPFAGHQPVLLLSNGAGGMINASTSHLPDISTEFHHSASVGDIDRDGDLDILGVTLSELRVYILVNDGNGSFALRTAGLPLDIVSEEANQDVGALTLAYVNDDNLLDIVFGWYHNAPQLEVAVTLQNESGEFNEVQRISFSQKFESGGIDLLLAEDLDGDGDDDLVGKIDESTLPGVAGSGEIALFALRNDNGVYIDVTGSWLGSDIASELVPDSRIGGLYLQDVNGDQHADLLFAHAGMKLNQLGQYLLINDGRGRFSPATNVTIDSSDEVGPQFYTDHDNDGDIDIVAMLPDINQVGENFIQSGYELILLEKTDTGIATDPSYPINYSTNSGLINVELNAGTLGFSSLSFSIHSVEPSVDIQVLADSVSLLEESVTRMATFNPETGELFFPELAIDGEVSFVNATFVLSDVENLLFTLQSAVSN